MLLELNDVHTYYGASHILQGVSLNVEKGEIVSLLGRNGVGKTTTLRTIMGILHPKSGRIKFGDADITKYPTHRISKLGINYVAQENPVFPDLSVRENLAIAPVRLGAKNGGLEEIYEYFPLLKERRNQAASSLSGGERRILAFARQLRGKPDLLLLDEPFTGLSPVITGQFAQILKKFNEGMGTSVLLVEQHATLALKLANRCYIMTKGKISFEGSSEEAGKSEELKRLLGVYA